MSLDEASVSCRSRYGGDVIFYNPSKPGGKFHFRFYMLCCSTTYACIRLRMHTRNRSDMADAPPSPSPTTTPTLPTNLRPAEEQVAVSVTRVVRPKTTGLSDDENSDEQSATEEHSGKKKTVHVLLSLIMDMCQPLFGSGRIVNMDNYYTSPTAAWMLASEKVYMRGTCRTNRIGFPSGVTFTSQEKRQWGRGSIRCMVEKKNIAAFGWLDGNPVHFITTADGSGMTTVTRRIGRERKTIEAPIGIRQYNKGMQAVDRHDQLREGFSLADRHGFKKYYQKIALGLIDMAVVNAWIHYKIVNPEKCSHERARYEFMESMANSFLQFNWQDYYETLIPGEGDDILRLLTENKKLDRKRKVMESGDNDSQFPRLLSEQMGTSNRCTPIAVQQLMSGVRSKKKGLSCQVCSFEGRGTNIVSNVVACAQHRVRACTIVRESRPLQKADGSDVVDYSWRAPDTKSASCWDKLHKFYIPNGLFRDDRRPMVQPNEKILFQCCCVGSPLYKKKKEALGEPLITRGKQREDCIGNYEEEEERDIELTAV